MNDEIGDGEDWLNEGIENKENKEDELDKSI